MCRDSRPAPSPTRGPCPTTLRPPQPQPTEPRRRPPPDFSYHSLPSDISRLYFICALDLGAGPRSAARSVPEQCLL